MRGEPSWKTVGLATVVAAVLVVAAGLWLLPSDDEATPVPPTLPPPLDAVPGAGSVLDGFLPAPDGLGEDWTEVLRVDSDDPPPIDAPLPGEVFTIMRACGDDVLDLHGARGVAASVFTGPSGSTALFGASLHPDEGSAEEMLATFDDREILRCLAGVREAELEEAIVADVEIDSSIDDLIVPPGLDELVVARRLRTEVSRDDRSIMVFSDVLAFRHAEYVVSMVFTTAGSAVRQQTRDRVLAEAYQRALTAPEPP